MSQFIAYIIDLVAFTGKLVLAILFAFYVILRIAFDALFIEAVNTYNFIFGANHSAALVVFSTIGVIMLLAYDKLLTIEINMTMFKALRKRVTELEEQNLVLKNAQNQQAEDLRTAYMRLYKEFELKELSRDTKIKKILNKFQKMEREVKQYI
jgi:hypothetical protein